MILWVAAFVLLGAALVGLGMLLTHVLVDAGLGAVDTDVVRWFVGERAPDFNTVTRGGTDLGSTGVVLGIAGVAGIALALARRWRQFGFMLFALTLEFSLFLLAVTIVDRHRPRVAELDAAPPTSSFPSGHSATALTLYLGLAIVGSTLVRSSLVRALVWFAGLALPLLVAVSRVYRGMHFPSDVIAGLLLASAALAIALFAVRCTAAAGMWRDRTSASTDQGPGEARETAPSSARSSMRSPPRGATSRVGVLAHSKKELDGSGLDSLRERLAEHGVEAPLWREIVEPDEVAGAVADLVEAGVETLFVWGGDGTVQQCIEALGDTPVALAILPAGTANLLAANLGVPTDLDEAVTIGLAGPRRSIDLGTVNGERFAVMAGVGFDALIVSTAEGGLKDRLGRLAYVAAGVSAVGREAVQLRVVVDGGPWFEGAATCVLVGNMGDILGGISAFPDASPDDGRLDVGVITADGPVDWARTLGSVAKGEPSSSPFVETTLGRTIDVLLDTPVPYELDGDVRPETRRLRFRVQPSALRVCVPAPEEEK